MPIRLELPAASTTADVVESALVMDVDVRQTGKSLYRGLWVRGERRLEGIQMHIGRPLDI
jgi:hypothetical protein